MTELLAKTNDYKQERRIHPHSSAIICGICGKKILHVQKFLIGARKRALFSCRNSETTTDTQGHQGIRSTGSPLCCFVSFMVSGLPVYETAGPSPIQRSFRSNL